MQEILNKQELQRVLLNCRFQSIILRNTKTIRFGDFTVVSLQKIYSVECQKYMQVEKTQFLPSGVLSGLKTS